MTTKPSPHRSFHLEPSWRRKAARVGQPKRSPFGEGLNLNGAAGRRMAFDMGIDPRKLPWVRWAWTLVLLLLVLVGIGEWL
jgi:hypothetical protein